MIRTHLDKIASVTRNLRLGRQVTLTENIEAQYAERKASTINWKTSTGA